METKKDPKAGWRVRRDPTTGLVEASWREAPTFTAAADTTPPPPSRVKHPPHYGGAADPYEAIKVIEAWGAGFNVGSALKYIRRAGKKAGESPLTDLEKARFYLDREIMLITGIQPAERVRVAVAENDDLHAERLRLERQVREDGEIMDDLQKRIANLLRQSALDSRVRDAQAKALKQKSKRKGKR